ncbi:uncharacterized, partial [Tachysurus ichikawai]
GHIPKSSDGIIYDSAKSFIICERCCGLGTDRRGFTAPLGPTDMTNEPWILLMAAEIFSASNSYLIKSVRFRMFVLL